MAQGWGFQVVRAYPSSAAPSKSTNENPKHAPSGPAARRKEVRAVIRAIGASKTITSVWMVLADLGAFAADGWAEATYDGLARDSHAKRRMAIYAVKYGEAIGLLAVDVRRPVRGGPNLPNRYRFTLDHLPSDPSAVESFWRWLVRVQTCTLKPRVQVAPGSVRTRIDVDEVPFASRTSLSGAEHPQAATPGKNGDGRSGCSAPDGSASFGTGSGRDSEQEARAEYRACPPASGAGDGPEHVDGDYAAGEAATERQRVLRELAEWDDDETLPPRLTPDVMRRARSLPPHTCERGGSTMGLIRAGADQRGEWGGNRMRLIDANEGDRLERGVEPVEIVSVERHRGFVTYFRNGDRARVFTATATHDDAGSSPPRRAASGRYANWRISSAGRSRAASEDHVGSRHERA